jgi:uroporphyrinogen-III synthase
MRVVVTRPESEARQWVDSLRGHGFDVLLFPLISIAETDRPADLRATWQRLATFDAVMFVSGNAVRHFFAAAPAGETWPAGARAWATGNGTRDALLEAGVPAMAIDAPPPEAPQFDSETLWQQVAGQVDKGKCMLVVRGGDTAGRDEGRDWLSAKLRAAGAQVEVVVAYLRRVPMADPAVLGQLKPAEDVWLFSSSQAIAHLRALLPRQDWSRSRALATHPRIAETARSAGFGVVCESRPGLDAVVAALESFR